MDNFNPADMDLESDLFDDDLATLSDRDLAEITTSRFDSAFEHDNDSTMSIQPSSSGSHAPPSEISTLTPSASGSQTTWYSKSIQRRSWIWLHGTQVLQNRKPAWRCRLCYNNPK